MICINRWQAHYIWHCIHTCTLWLYQQVTQVQYSHVYCRLLLQYMYVNVIHDCAVYHNNDTNITWLFVNMDMETIIWKCAVFFQIESMVMIGFQPWYAYGTYSAYIYMHTYTEYTYTPPTPLFWTHLMMMVREDHDLPPFSSSTCAPVAVRMSVRLALPLLTTWP